MSARSARRPLPALIFLVALAVLAVLVWVRVTQRDSNAESSSLPVCATAAPGALPANSSITINVLNGNGANGLAATTLQAFQTAGFAAGQPPGDVQGITGVGTIAAGPQGAAAAKVVAFYLPGATVTTDSGLTGNTVTVSLGPSFTGLAGADAVKAAMAQAQATQSAAPPPSPSATPSSSGSAGSAGGGSPAASPSATCRTASS